MYKVLIVGNPNVGKSTLFNSLTKSSVHTGNFHGVTVEQSSKVVKIDNNEYEIVDLPGMYSLNSFSGEELIAKNEVLKKSNLVLYVVDANSIKRNLYLALQLKEIGVNFKILINNYNYFKKKGNYINVEILEKELGVSCQIVNAKKTKPTAELFSIKESKNESEYLYKFLQETKLEKNEFIKEINKEEQSEKIKKLYPSLIKTRYEYLQNILDKTVKIKENYVYGESKLDKVLLNPFVMGIGFLSMFLIVIYLIFFCVGAFLSDLLSMCAESFIVNPVVNFLYNITDNIWLIEFFSNGVFSSFVTILSFLPQVCLLFVFLTILEDSGIISRMAYVFDDFLTPLGLNGKAIYILLMGLGCNTMSTLATRNLNGKNLKTKTAIINPYISCMARLPVFVLVASAFFGKFSYFVVAGLYALGFVVAILVALILNKTTLPNKSSELLLEFPPLRTIDAKHLLSTVKVNALDLIKRVFGVVLSVGIIVWILTHTKFNLCYTDTISESIMFIVANKIGFLFAPIGLNNAGVVCALIVGIMAKELIVSTFSVCNNVTNTKILISSLSLVTSVIHFNLASAVSFLIFSLLYSPCVSNLAVLKKETDTFTMWFCLVSQFTIAYMLSFVVYQSLVNGVLVTLISLLIISLILFAVIFIFKKVKKQKCLSCGKCK